ncbi:HAAS signaling domain-containing protein [Micromonospora inyonensis]|uniref:HAAS signaling domain-containing protein n=1 Tax=Micromonospora inyonensis TaxID=47866 RepID=UPI000AEDB03D|nr:permease prefix domain 1-containing protein [Micromonospora inyonensis]
MTSRTDRYLAATLRSVPVARREEIATELRASIDDMIEARTTDGQDTAAAEREVLTELGDPAQLAARYAGRRLYLVGPRYYLAWERLLKRLLTFLPATVGIVVGLLGALDGNAGGRSARASPPPSGWRSSSPSGSPWSSRCWSAPTST